MYGHRLVAIAAAADRDAEERLLWEDKTCSGMHLMAIIVVSAASHVAGGRNAAEEVQGQVQREPSWGNLGVLEANGPGLPAAQPLGVT